MSKFYKYLFLMAWFTVAIYGNQKLVGQNQVQTFNRHVASGSGNIEESLSPERTEFTRSNQKFTKVSMANGIYFLHQILMGETEARKSRNYKVYRSI